MNKNTILGIGVGIGIITLIGVGGYFLVRKVARVKAIKDFKNDCIAKGCEVEPDGCYCSDTPANLTSAQANAIEQFKKDCIAKGCELEPDGCYCKG
tara:strand:- start:716 stop:1003 length:288 start_codon:yes stop_codon:yes gene_type:complete